MNNPSFSKIEDEETFLSSEKGNINDGNNNKNFEDEKIFSDIERGVDRLSNGRKVKNVLEKNTQQIFWTKDFENEIIADKDFVADMIARFPKKSNETKNLETRDFVFKEYKIAKKTYDQNFHIKTIYTPVLGVFDANETIYDEKNVLLTEKDFEASDYKLYEKYGTQPFTLLPKGKKESMEINFGEKIETGDQKLKSDLEFQLLNIKRLVETMNIDTAKIPNYNNFFVKNIQKPIFSDFYFDQMKNILIALGEFGGLKNICQKASEILQKIQNPEKKIPIIDINFETEKHTQNLTHQLREIFGAKNIEAAQTSQTLDFEKTQLQNLYGWFENVIKEKNFYQQKGYTIVRDGVLNTMLSDEKHVFVLPESAILENKKLFFELKKSTGSEKNLSDIEGFETIEDIKSFPLLESTHFEYKKDNKKTDVVELKFGDFEVDDEKEAKKPDLVIGDFDDYGQNDLKIQDLNIDEEIVEPKILTIESKIPQISLMPKSQNSRKSIYRNLKSYGLSLIDKHYYYREASFGESILATGLKMGVDTKRAVEDFYSNAFFKSDYEKTIQKRNKQIKENIKLQEKEMLQRTYSLPIWADRKTSGVDKTILKEGKSLLALWRRKTFSFSKNKYFHRDNLINFLSKNNLTFRDIGMTKAERKFILS